MYRTKHIVALIQEKGVRRLIDVGRLGKSVHVEAQMRLPARTSLSAVFEVFRKKSAKRGKTLYVDLSRVGKRERNAYLKAELFAKKGSRQDIQIKGGAFFSRLGRVPMKKTVGLEPVKKPAKRRRDVGFWED